MEASPRGVWPGLAPAPGVFEQTFSQDTGPHYLPRGTERGEDQEERQSFHVWLKPQMPS